MSGDHIRVELRLDEPQRAGQYGRVISQESKTEHCGPICGDRNPRTMGTGLDSHDLDRSSFA